MTQHVVQFSGGIGSAVTALRVAERYGTDSMTLLIADTRVEDEDLWRFSRQFAAHLGLELTVVCDGRTPWELFRDVRFLGNNRFAPCTRYLKQIPCREWMEEHAPPGEAHVYIGIEPTVRDRRRIPAIARNWQPWQVCFPLAEGPDWAKEQLLMEISALGIAPPRMYAEGFAHNNCGGACVRAGQRQWSHLLNVRPERYARAEAEEEALRAELGNVAILRDRRGGESRPLPLRELRARQQ